MDYFVWLITGALLMAGCKKNQDHQTQGLLSVKKERWPSDLPVKVCWDESFANNLGKEYTKSVEDAFYVFYDGYINLNFTKPWGICKSNEPVTSVVIKAYEKATSRFDGEALCNSENGPCHKINPDLLISDPTKKQKPEKEPDIHLYLHEFFHIFGALHEHSRHDNELCNTVGARVLRKDDPDFKVIGKVNYGSISSYCTKLADRYNKNFRNMSAGDAFTMAYLYGFPDTQKFKSLMLSHPVHLLIRKVPTSFPIKFSDAQKKEEIKDEMADLILWVQMMLSFERIKLNSNQHYNSNNIIFDKNMQEALMKYQKKFNLAVANGEITEETWNFLVESQRNYINLELMNNKNIEIKVTPVAENQTQVSLFYLPKGTHKVEFYWLDTTKIIFEKNAKALVHSPSLPYSNGYFWVHFLDENNKLIDKIYIKIP